MSGTRMPGQRRPGVMFFYLSRLFALVQPSTLILIFLGTGILAALWGRQRLARRLLAIGTIMLAFGAFSPIGYALLVPLEDRFPRGPLPQTAAGIIILGGFEDAQVSNARGVLATNEAGERLAEALVLARRLPAARVVFTGGIASLLPVDLDAAGPIGRYLEDVGIERARIVLEGRSRSTWENAIFTREILNPSAGDRWVLVTSAFHMPRAIGVFRQAGYDVTAWPVDYRTRGARDLLRFSDSIPNGLERLDLAFREWVGLLAYRLSDRTDALWPGPRAQP